MTDCDCPVMEGVTFHFDSCPFRVERCFFCGEEKRCPRFAAYLGLGVLLMCVECSERPIEVLNAIAAHGGKMPD